MAQESDRAYQAFIDAQQDRLELWPEPETTQLFRSISRAVRRIIGSHDSYLISTYYGYDEAAAMITSSVFLKLEQFRGRSQFSTWLFRTATNEFISLVRTIKRRREIQLEALAEMPARPQKGHELDLPSTLTDEEQRIIRMRYLDGLTLREIARNLGISLGGVHGKWKDAAAKLKSQQNTYSRS